MAKQKLGRAAEKAREARKRKRRRREWALDLAKEVLVAIIIVLIVMGTLYAYSGIWPPMVVVESQSMMHGTDSQIGIIDTGDLTIVKKITTRHDIVTYVEGRPSYTVSYKEAGLNYAKNETFKGAHVGVSTYGDHGEVIIYDKNGRTDETPVIHRAIAWFEPNTTVACTAKLGYVAGGDFPDIRNANHPDGLKCVIMITIQKVGYNENPLVINVNTVVANAIAIDGQRPFAGFLTHGDNNGVDNPPLVCDQESLRDRHTGRMLAPNKVEWVIGKAVGELPWFGALKLVASGAVPSDSIPPSSWRGLISTIGLIIVIMLIIDIATSQYAKRKAKEKKKPRDDKDEDEEPVVKRKPKKAKKEHDEVIEEIDLDDEYGDEFKDMATSKPKKKNKR